MQDADKSKNKPPRSLQRCRTKQEVTEALKGRNQDGQRRVVVLHLSLLIHRCIDCVFIWRGSEGESEAVISQRFPSSSVSHLAAKMLEELLLL